MIDVVGKEVVQENTDLLRFFAGCDTIVGVAKNLQMNLNKENQKLKKLLKLKKLPQFQNQLLLKKFQK